MFQTNKQSRSIAFEFSSKTGLAFRAIRECLEYLGKYSADSELIDTHVILRELLRNALEHGTKSDVERLVKCGVEHLGEKRLKIVVEDQGDGFDYRNVVACVDDLEDPVRRSGYFLIKKLSERIEFNNRGNRVTVYQKVNA